MAVMEESVLVLGKYIRVFRGDGALYLLLAFQWLRKKINENGQKKGELWSNCEMSAIGESECGLGGFILHFQILCWFEIMKKQVIKK